MKVRCDRCGEHFSIADNPALRGRAIKARCRSCRHIVTAVPEEETPAAASGSLPSVAMPRMTELHAVHGLAATSPRFEGSALIEIRQLAARTLAAHTGPREPSARVAIEALLGSSRMATLIPMPEPARAPVPGWLVLLIVTALAMVGGTATFGLLLVRYADAARSAARSAAPLFLAASAVEPATPFVVPAPQKVAPAVAQPQAPAPAPSLAQPLAVAPVTPAAPATPPASAAPPSSAAEPATEVAVRQRHRGGTARSHAHHGHSGPRSIARAPHTPVAAASTHGHSRSHRMLDDDDLLRILDSTRAAGESTRAHGR